MWLVWRTSSSNSTIYDRYSSHNPILQDPSASSILCHEFSSDIRKDGIFLCFFHLVLSSAYTELPFLVKMSYLLLDCNRTIYWQILAVKFSTLHNNFRLTIEVSCSFFHRVCLSSLMHRIVRFVYGNIAEKRAIQRISFFFLPCRVVHRPGTWLLLLIQFTNLLDSLAEFLRLIDDKIPRWRITSIQYRQSSISSKLFLLSSSPHDLTIPTLRETLHFFHSFIGKNSLKKCLSHLD